MNADFCDRYAVNPDTDCWQWMGATSKGYGKFGKTAAHRYAYTLWVGTIEPNNHVHHLCRNRLCVNPEHLAQLTPTDHAHEHKGEGCNVHAFDEWNADSGNCRACNRVAARKLRDSRRVPCVQCGELRLNGVDTGDRNSTGLCAGCYHTRLRDEGRLLRAA